MGEIINTLLFVAYKFSYIFCVLVGIMYSCSIEYQDCAYDDNRKSTSGADSDEGCCTITCFDAGSDIVRTEFHTLQNKVHDEKLVVHAVEQPGKSRAKRVSR